MSVKVYKGGSYVDMSYLRRYNGNSWIDIAGGNEFICKAFSAISSNKRIGFIGTGGNSISAYHYSLTINDIGFTPKWVCYGIEVGDITNVLGNQSDGCLRHLAYHWSGNPMYATEQYLTDMLPSFNSSKVVVPVHFRNTQYTLYIVGYK